VLGFVGGALCAIARADGPPWLKRLVGAYVEVIRNTPLLVQIFLVYFRAMAQSAPPTKPSTVATPESWSVSQTPAANSRQIFLVYFGIAVLGIRVDANVAAVLALVVNVVAYTCDIRSTYWLTSAG
jgi:polar amino acid transport system permease protein